MGTKRQLRFKVVSSVGGHFGFYQLDLTLQGAAASAARTSASAAWAEMPQLPTSHQVDYLLDPETGRCTAKLRPFWQKKCQAAKQNISIALNSAGAVVPLWLAGLCRSQACQEAEGRSAKARSRVEMGKPTAQWRVGAVGFLSSSGPSWPAAPGSAKVLRSNSQLSQCGKGWKLKLLDFWMAFPVEGGDAAKFVPAHHSICPGACQLRHWFGHGFSRGCPCTQGKRVDWCLR